MKQTLTILFIFIASLGFGGDLYRVTCPNKDCGKVVISQPVVTTTCVPVKTDLTPEQAKAGVEAKDALATAKSVNSKTVTTTKTFTCPGCKKSFKQVQTQTQSTRVVDIPAKSVTSVAPK